MSAHRLVARHLAFILVVCGATECLGDDPPSAANLPAAAEVGQRAQVDVLHVNNLGDLDSIEFRGVSQFPLKDIRCALRWDPKFQAAARPSRSTGDFLAVLESRLRDGYQSSGCPNAKAWAWCDGSHGRVVVRVEEGPRYRTGKIIVTGTSHVDHAQLVKWLTTSQSPRRWQASHGPEVLSNLPDDGITIWTSDKNLNYNEQQRSTLESGIHWALVEQGFPYTPFTIELKPADTPGVADLHVDLAGDAEQSTVGRIDVRGLDRDTREKLLAYLELAPGDRFDAALLDRIDKKLSDSCRYWRHTITAQFASRQTKRDAASDEGVTLVLDLEEFTPAPPLNQPLSEVDEILRKAAAWINRFQTDAPADLIVEEQPNADADLTETTVLRPSALAADGRVALDVQSESPTGWLLDHAIIATPRSFDVFDWRNQERFSICLDKMVNLELKIEPDRKENGEYAQHLFFGWAITSHADDDPKRDVVWTMKAVLVALVYAAHRPGAETRIENGVLTASASGVEVSFDAKTGAFISLRADTGDGSILVARLQRGGFDAIANSIRQRAGAFANRFDASHPIDSALRFAIHQLQRQPAIAENSTQSHLLWAIERLEKSLTVARLISRLEDEWGEFVSSDSPNSDDTKFFIGPASPNENDSLEQIVRLNVVYYVPGLADVLFPRGSWPWTLSREAAFLFLSDITGEDSVEQWNRAVHELARLERTRELSPIAAMLCTRLMRYRAGVRAFDTLGTRIAACGLRQSTDNTVLKDARLLLSGDHAWAKLVRKLAEEFGELPDEDQQRFVAMLPDACGESLTQYIARRKEKPDEPTGEALEQEFVDRWNSGLREAVEAQLQSYTAEVAQTPKTSK